MLKQSITQHDISMK